MTYRILHIGAGEWSRFAHAPVLRNLATGPQPQVSLEAICDVDKARAVSFCAEFGYKRAYTVASEAVKEISPDAIYCTVNPAATFSVVRDLIPLKIPLFIEKPPGASVEQARTLAALAAEYGTNTYVAFNRRRIPSIERMKGWVREHSVRFARAEMLRNRRLEPEFALHTGIHALDCIRFLLGDPRLIDVYRHPYSAADVTDSFVRLHFDSGAIAEVSLVLDCGFKRESYSLHSAGASCVAVLGANYSNNFLSSGDWQYSAETVEQATNADADPLVSGGFLAEHLAFLAVVSSGKEPDCNLQDAALSMQLAAAVQAGFCGELPR